MALARALLTCEDVYFSKTGLQIGRNERKEKEIKQKQPKSV